MNLNLLQDAVWRGPMMLSMQRAISADFNVTDWQVLGYETGCHDYISRHPRLLRSLSFGDEDYGGCVFQVLEHLARTDVRALAAVIKHPKVLVQLEQHQSAKLAELGYQGGYVSAPPTELSAPDVVHLALRDAQQLLASSGAPSAIDRLHTAMHGYLKAACSAASIAIPADATLTQAYKALRSNHPALQSVGKHEGEMGRILASFATVLDSLNTLRNHGSVAHPNEHIVEEAEGMLAVNAVHTIFNYLHLKILSSSSVPSAQGWR